MAERISQTPTLTRALLLDVLTAYDLNPAAALLAVPELVLVKDGPANITPDNILTDFTVATFTGYAAYALHSNFAGVVNLDDGSGLGLLAVKTWVCTTAPASPGETIKGYVVNANTTNTLYQAEYFATPVPIIRAGDFLTLTLIMPLPFVMTI